MKTTIFIITLLLSINSYAQIDTISELEFIEGCNIANEKLYSKYANGNDADSITSISFVGFNDTIPDKLKIFKNVRKIILVDSQINNLYIFPLLESVYLDIEEGVIINENDNWLKMVKGIKVHKCEIRGVTSFKNIPHLEELVMTYSKFEKGFPSDINSLKNIKRIKLGVYTGEVNLNLIDVTKPSSIQEVEVVSWTGNITGIPYGVKNSNLQRLSIQHPLLTQEEKNILREFEHNK
ncbi:hypothetical protein [Bacteroides sp. 224]|uniref:hypothetical protein n=1 Tax=Bacteroides sp. 224 TaxID=2302936 RepID=UPI0013D34900|nr:hypothetical protein [Bacteroides sp. 224]NDV66691.1 hypothetical protein [Bacteroides sp. 224]